LRSEAAGHPIGLRFQQRILNDGQTGGKWIANPSSALLHDVRELVGKNTLAAPGCRIVLTGGEVNVIAARESQGADLPRVRAGMNADVSEVRAEK
jgi:hypothetical protein